MIKTVIFGSCVARDTIAIMPDSAKVVCYVARQGMLSAASGASDVAGEVRLDSAFQARSVEHDIQGNAVEQLRASARKGRVVLLDLIDERLGSHLCPDGSFITRTWELTNSGILENQADPLPLLEFGTDEHFELWHAAAEQVVAQIAKFRLPTAVLAPPFADHDLNGDPLTYLDQPIEAWNAAFDRYYNAIEKMGLAVLRPPSELAVADADHRWGLAPFHYAPPMYEWFRDAITAAGPESRKSKK